MTDITYIRTHEGWLCLAVVIDLFSRRAVGWSPLSRLLCNRLPGNGRGTCHDTAGAGSVFQRLKRERIRRRPYATRDAARQDVFGSIEMFCNSKRKHTNNGLLSPIDFERRQQKMNEAGV